MRSTTATRTSTDSAEDMPPAPPRPRIGLLGHHAGALRRHAAGHHRAPGARTRASSAQALAGRRRRRGRRRRPATATDIDRIVARASRRQGLDGLLVVMLTYGPAMRVARALSHDRAADLPGQRPAGRRRSRAAWDMARPDLQPGHPRRAGHGQRHGPRRAPVPRHHRRLARRLVPRGGRRLGAGRRRRLALARAEGRRLRLRDERDGRHPRRRPRAAARRSARRSTRSRPDALHRAAAGRRATTTCAR